MSLFSEELKRMRTRYAGKQLALACEMGCTEAAISMWERGKRRPSLPLVQAMIAAMRAQGAGPKELEEFFEAYTNSAHDSETSLAALSENGASAQQETRGGLDGSAI